MFRIFGSEFFDKADADVCVSHSRGMLEYDERTLDPTFSTVEDGPLLLWTALNTRNEPPKHQYVVSADVATGLGGSYTSNSAMVVIDMVTMEQVAEFASNSTPVADFADLCIATAKWFHEAYLTWEINGPGSGFTQRVKDRGYHNYFLRPLPAKQGAKKTRDMGWWTDARTKELMFSEFSRTVQKGELKLRSEMLVKECSQYVRIGGKIEHVEAASTKDDSSKGQAHGDRVIAAAVGLQAVRDRPLMKVSYGGGVLSADNPPPNTMAARMKEYQDANKPRDDWDDRTNADLARASA
jgi:hypothetical protein